MGTGSRLRHRSLTIVTNPSASGGFPGKMFLFVPLRAPTPLHPLREPPFPWSRSPPPVPRLRSPYTYPVPVPRSRTPFPYPVPVPRSRTPFSFPVLVPRSRSRSRTRSRTRTRSRPRPRPRTRPRPFPVLTSLSSPSPDSFLLQTHLSCSSFPLARHPLTPPSAEPATNTARPLSRPRADATGPAAFSPPVSGPPPPRQCSARTTSTR